MIVLDTDVLIEIFDRHSEKGDEALQKVIESDDSVGTTAINLHEIMYGLQKYAKPVKEVLQLPVLGYTKQDAQLSARLEFEAEKTGTPVRRTDAMIAAIVMDSGARLYTFDLGHFKALRAHGLKLLS